MTLCNVRFPVGIIMVLVISALLEMSAAAAPAAPATASGGPAIQKNSSSDTSQQKTYVVKRGDYLAKIVAREFKLSKREFVALVREICRINNIKNVNHIQVGQALIIPRPGRSFSLPTASIPSKPSTAVKAEAPVTQLPIPEQVKSVPTSEAPRQVLQLEKPKDSAEQRATFEEFRPAWSQIVTDGGRSAGEPHSVQTSNYSLQLDPNLYPTFPAVGGGKIIVDRLGNMPGVVKSMVLENNPNTRIVSEPSASGRGFLSSMLSAAGFYSVEENFHMEFGAEPTLSIRTDFKVEKTSDSAVNQDMMLVSSSSSELPPVLKKLLKQEGFSYVAPFAGKKAAGTHKNEAPNRGVILFAGKSPDPVALILIAAGVTFETNRTIDLFSGKDDGIALSVKADYYFERNGKRCVLVRTDKAQYSANLFKVLESRGYNVTLLQKADSFNTMVEKVLATLKLPATFARHNLLMDDDLPYVIQMSGFLINDASVPGGQMFVSENTADDTVRTLLAENGFSVRGR